MKSRSFAKTKHLAFFISAIMVFSNCIPQFPVQAAVHIWDGSCDTSWHDLSDTLEEVKEFHISTPEQLAGLAKEVNENGVDFKGETIYLDADIYLNDDENYINQWTPISCDNAPTFLGNFIGQEHRIYGLYCTGQMKYAGLFGKSEGNISLVILRSGTINVTSDYTSESYVGGICAYSTGTISSCNNCANITAFKNAYDTELMVGGICGMYAGSSQIQYCLNIGDIHAHAMQEEARGLTNLATCTGGICGAAYSNILSCTNTGNIYGEISGHPTCAYCHTGGISGICNKSFKECSNRGNIVSSYNAGGASTDEISAGGILGSNGRGGVKNELGVNTGNISLRIAEKSSITGYCGGICGMFSPYQKPAVVPYDWCFNQGIISIEDSSSTSEYNVGGILGYCDGTITRSLNKGIVFIHESLSRSYAGGICGNKATVSESANNGSISCPGISGGIVGYGLPSNCFNHAEVNGRIAGGIAGQGSISNSYNTGKVTGTEYSGGVLGKNGVTSNCFYLNTSAERGTGDDKTSGADGKKENIMKSSALVDKLGESFYYINNQYPTLKWIYSEGLVEFFEDGLLTSENTSTTPTITTSTTKTTTTTTSANDHILPGDVNQDNMITVSDAILLARIVAEDSTLKVNSIMLSAADYDKDGFITTADTNSLLKKLAGL